MRSFDHFWPTSLPVLLINGRQIDRRTRTAKMRLRSSIGYCVLGVLFTSFSGTSSSDPLTELVSPIARKSIDVNSRKPRWVGEMFENVVSSIGSGVNSIRNQASQILDNNVELVIESMDKNLDEYLAAEEEYGFSPDNVLFKLYTKNNIRQPQALKSDSPQSLLNSHFDKDKSTVFITHGWLNNDKFEACTRIREAYLSGYEGVNVIIVDWSFYSLALYPSSVRHVKAIGREVARMIESLRIYAQLDLRTTTLVGHSLGAHIMGIAGKAMNGMVNQIFGLDPARPLFKNRTNPHRLSTESARNVQVIHTNGNRLGLAEPLGHADFYPNGGTNQPGCCAVDLISDGHCSHARSIFLFAESIESQAPFQGIQCYLGGKVPQCTGPIGIMGGRSNYINEVGIFYLKTRAASPFARNLRPRNKNISRRTYH